MLLESNMYCVLSCQFWVLGIYHNPILGIYDNPIKNLDHGI